MRKFCVLLFLFLSCSTPQKKMTGTDENMILSNSSVSDCGGFQHLAKRSLAPYVPINDDYCSAEKLIWIYDASAKKLNITHCRFKANCGAKIVMTMINDENGVVIDEQDTSSMPTDCECVFDTKCEIRNVEGERVSLALNGKSYTLQLSQSTGSIILSTEVLYQCDPMENYPVQ